MCILILPKYSRAYYITLGWFGTREFPEGFYREPRRLSTRLTESMCLRARLVSTTAAEPSLIVSLPPRVPPSLSNCEPYVFRRRVPFLARGCPVHTDRRVERKVRAPSLSGDRDVVFVTVGRSRRGGAYLCEGRARTIRSRDNYARLIVGQKPYDRFVGVGPRASRGRVVFQSYYARNFRRGVRPLKHRRHNYTMFSASRANNLRGASTTTFVE